MPDQLNISTIVQGALQERAAIEIEKILQNIADPNTDDKKPRKLQVELVFKPIGRDSASVEIKTKSSVQPYNPVATQIYIGQNGEGKFVGEEYVKGQMKNQLPIVDKETGEIIEEQPANVTNINKKISGIQR